MLAAILFPAAAHTPTVSSITISHPPDGQNNFFKISKAVTLTAVAP